MRLDGQSSVEYGLLIATISVLTLLSANAFGGAVLAWFHYIFTRVTALPF
jgi:Flp pilus assembly pilin Flp